MERKRLGLWAPILVIAAALLMLAVSTGTVDAAPRAGKGGGKGHGGTTYTATCSFTPNPATSGQAVVEYGSGFPANSTIGYSVTGPFGTSVGFLTTDSTGSFSMSGTAGPAGTYTVNINWNGGATSCTLEVV